jgi:Transcriptional regulatory protein, C terminal
MEDVAAVKRVVRFGLFEVDFASQELRKSGIKIKIQDQPFQILALLLEQPGQIVTREEIQKRLWAGDTFVDFDLGLNSAVKKLRQALGDESENLASSKPCTAGAIVFSRPFRVILPPQQSQSRRSRHNPPAAQMARKLTIVSTSNRSTKASRQGKMRADCSAIFYCHCCWRSVSWQATA